MNEGTEDRRRGSLVLQAWAVGLAYFALFGALLYAVYQAAQHAA